MRAPRNERFIFCTLVLQLALSAALIASPHGAAAQGYVPHADTTDWRWWLHLANNVSRQGNREAGIVQPAQDSALGLAAVALEHVHRDPDSPPWATAKIETKLGEFRYMTGDVEGARKHWLTALSDSDTSDAQGRIEREETLFRLGILAQRHPELDTTGAAFREARGLVRRTWDASTPEEAARVFRLAEVHAYLEHIDGFYELLEHVIRIHEAHPDSDPRWAVRALVFFGEGTSKPRITQIRAARDSQDSSIAFAEYALKLSEDYFGPDDTLTAFVLYRLGDYYDRRGDYALLDSLWSRAWHVYRRAVPPEHIEYQGGLLRMGGLAYARGDFVEAEKMFRESLRLRIATQGPGHPETAAMWARMGRLYQATGRYDAADSCYRHALEIRERAYEQVESNTAQSLGLLGSLRFDEGDYVEAEKYYRRAYEIRERVHGPLHGRTASSLNDLAQLYLAWGNLEEAERCLQKALEAQTTFLGAMHPDVARSLDQLAEIQLGEGKLGDAGRTLARADSIRRTQPDMFKAEMADHLGLEAQLKAGEGDTDGCERLLGQSLNQAASVYSQTDLRLIPYLVRLARHRIELGLWTRAAVLVDRALAMRRAGVNEWHPYFADALECRASLCGAEGRYDSALAAAGLALQLRLRSFAVNAGVMPEREALMYEHSLLACRDLLLGLYFDRARARRGDAAGFPVQVLATKGAVAELVAARSRTRSETSSPPCAALEDTLVAERARAWQLYNQGLIGAPDSATSKLAGVMETIHALERRRVRLCGVGPAAGSEEAPTRTELQARLEPGEALLEYVRYRDAEQDRYAAVCLTAAGELHAADLGPARAVDDAVGEYRRHMLRLATAGAPPGPAQLAEYDDIAGRLSDRIWAPVASWLSRSSRLLIVPDAALNLVSFAGLRSTEGRYLVEEREIQYLTSVRALAQEGRPAATGNGLLALGDPDFDAAPASRLAAIEDTTVENAARYYSAATRSVRSACAGALAANLSPLPGSRRELEEVARVWSAHASETLRVCTGPSASEFEFKRCCRGTRVIHLATHGFYALGECSPDDPARLALHRWVAYENPLLLSGLYLAGANLHGAGASEAGVDDGTLTAAEVAELDLSGVQVVVLSSCESAVGDVRAGEGVYDLRRAFMQAGAATVVSALWPVGDDEAAAFIGALYADWGKPLASAMREAALGRLADLRRRHQPDHPLEWAGFIACGQTAGLAPSR